MHPYLFSAHIHQSRPTGGVAAGEAGVLWAASSWDPAVQALCWLRGAGWVRFQVTLQSCSPGPTLCTGLWGPAGLWGRGPGVSPGLLLCGWQSPIPERCPCPGLQKREGWGPEPRRLLPLPAPWSHLGQMGREPGCGLGNMLGTRCCHRAVPSQVNKLHTNHKQSAACHCRFGGRPAHGKELPQGWSCISG